MEETVFILSKYHFEGLLQALPHPCSEQGPGWGWPSGLSSSSSGPREWQCVLGPGREMLFLCAHHPAPDLVLPIWARVLSSTSILPDVHPPSWNSQAAQEFLGLFAASCCPTQIPKRDHGVPSTGKHISLDSPSPLPSDCVRSVTERRTSLSPLPGSLNSKSLGQP